MTRTIFLAALFLGAGVAACGGDKKGGGGGGGDRNDWSGKPLDVTINERVKNVAFTIKAPAGMKLEDVGDSGPEAITKRWEPDQKDAWNMPSFSVAYKAIPAKTIDDYVKDAMLDDKDVVAKKEELADGFLLVTHTKNKGIIRARVMKRKGEDHVECRASQAGERGPAPNADKSIVWLEQLCSTLTIN